MAKDSFRQLVIKYGNLKDPLDEARRKIAELLEGDIEKAKLRYLKFKKRT